MHRTFNIATMCACACILAVTIACGSSSPVSPDGATPGSSGAAPDGTTLKAGPPTAVAPGNNVTVDTVRPTLQIGAASGRFVTNQTFQYEFELLSSSGTVLRRQVQSGLSWTIPEDLQHDTVFGWRARAVLANAGGTSVGPWLSPTQSFRTLQFILPGCVNGRLTDPKAYFFWLINRKEGDPAGDWRQVLGGSGLPAGPTQGVRPGNAFFGLTQQIDSGGNLRGRVFLPTETQSAFGYFIQDVDVLSDPGASFWVWRPHGSPPYVARACP